MNTLKSKLDRWSMSRQSNRDEDERGSLPLAMLVVIVGMALSAALGPVIINQRVTTTFDMTRVQALDAAQAGVDAVVGQIRQSVTSGQGDPSQLPCTNDVNQVQNSPITGTIASGSLEKYSALVYYYVSDPVAHPGASVMICVPGSGTFDSGSGSVSPSYARIVSTGTAGTAGNGVTGGRTLTSIYKFNTDNSNISGGTIRVYPGSGDGSNQFCIDIGSGTPTANVTTATLQPCSVTFPPIPQQVFAYRSDLTMQLVSSVGTVVGGTTYRYGLCLDIKSTASVGGGVTGPANGSLLVLQQCAAAGSTPIWSQQWSFDDHSSLQASRTDSATTGNLSGYCMTTSVNSSTAHTASTTVTLAACDGNLTSPTDAWIPNPSLGAGAATKPTSNQWINFQQFGRCINLPNSDVNALYVIAPGCKQNPDQPAVAANQKWYWDSTSKQFYLNVNGGTYCMYSPLTEGGRVQVTACSSHPNATVSQMQWARTTPATNAALPYSQQYRLVDTAGRCLSLATITSVPGDPYGSTYSVWPKLVTATCDGSTLQQWNASNNVGSSAIQNTKEN